ncbi:MAG: hypothetical protein V3S29_12840 [bacterium]
MANKAQPPAPPSPKLLWERKVALTKKFLAVTRDELLLVDLEGLTPLLEQKAALILEIGKIDQNLAELGAPGAAAANEASQKEIAQLVAAILENEQALEARMDDERTRLRRELREFDRQTTLRRYLEGVPAAVRTVDLKK